MTFSLIFTLLESTQIPVSLMFLKRSMQTCEKLYLNPLSVVFEQDPTLKLMKAITSAFPTSAGQG